MQEKLAILLSRKLSGEATSDELAELEAWIRNNPQDHYLIDTVQSYWSNHPVSNFPNISDNVHFERILNKAEKQNDAQNNLRALTIKKRRKWMAAAAVFFRADYGGCYFC